MKMVRLTDSNNPSVDKDKVHQARDDLLLILNENKAIRSARTPLTRPTIGSTAVTTDPIAKVNPIFDSRLGSSRDEAPSHAGVKVCGNDSISCFI